MRIWAFALAGVVWALASGVSAQEASSEEVPSEVSADDGGGSAADPEADREARDLYNAGTAAFQDGRFEDALQRWQDAFELSARPELLYNIATALDRLGRMSEAADYYERFLQERPDAANENYVRSRIEVIRNLSAGEESEDVGPAPEPLEDSTMPEAEMPTTSGANLLGPVLLFSVAGATAIVGLVTGLLANDKYQSLEESCPDHRCSPELAGEGDSLRTLTTVTDVMFGLAIAAAAAGLVWTLVTLGEDDDEVDLACGLTGCVARTRF